MLYIVLFVILSLIFAIGMPFLQNINTHMWAASESIVLDSEEVANSMEDQNVANAMLAAFQAQKDNFTTNVEFTGFMNQWAWVFIGIIIFVVIFIKIREEKEIDRQGF